MTKHTHDATRRQHTAAIPNKYVQLWVSGCNLFQTKGNVYPPPPPLFFYFSSCDVSLGRGSINSITLGGELASCYIRNMALWISHQTTFLERISALINIRAQQMRRKTRTSLQNRLEETAAVAHTPQCLNGRCARIYGHNVMRPAVWRAAVMCEQ